MMPRWNFLLEKNNKNILCAVIISAVAPCVYGKIRLEYIVVYFIFLLTVLFALCGGKFEKKSLRLSALLFLATIVVVCNDLLVVNTFRVVDFYAVINNFLEAAVLFFICSFFLTKCYYKSIFSMMELMVFLGGVAGIYALFTVLFDIEPVTKIFLGRDIEHSLWEQTYSLGRYTGIFNQPIEAGVFYSICLMVLFYVINKKRISLKKGLVYGVFIMLGGILSLSKNFVILGLFLSVLFGCIYNATLRKYTPLFFVLLSIFLFLLLYFFKDAPSYVNYANALFELYDKYGILSVLTAGRMGGGETEIGLLFKEVIDHAFFTGYGIGSYTPLDNGYLQYMYQGGIFALCLYVLFLVMIGWYGLMYFRKPEGGMLVFLSIYALFASIGGPVVTLNRANIFFIFIVCVNLVILQKEKNGVFWLNHKDRY